jgi:hypothetical protein
MNKKNTEYLLKKYPKLYAQYYWPMTQTCMNWGFDVGDGWNTLLKNLSRRITKLDPEGRVQADQVKSKFAGLRFYISGAPIEIADKIYKLINDAEEKSFHICEICGKKGKVRDVNGWYSTFCERHFKEHKDPNYLLRKRKKLKPFKHKTNKRYK